MIIISKVQMRGQRWGRERVLVICAVDMMGLEIKTPTDYNFRVCSACLRGGMVFNCPPKQFMLSSVSPLPHKRLHIAALTHICISLLPHRKLHSDTLAHICMSLSPCRKLYSAALTHICISVTLQTYSLFSSLFLLLVALFFVCSVL